MFFSGEVFNETAPNSRVLRTELSNIPQILPKVIQENIYISSDPNPGIADSIWHFYGDVDANLAHEILTEAVGEEDSFVFWGTSHQGSYPEEKITITEFSGLTGDIDSFTAKIEYLGDGQYETVRVCEFVETSPNSKIFRFSEQVPPVPEDTLYNWAASIRMDGRTRQVLPRNDVC